MKLSIIIPTLNEEENLSFLFSSLEDQEVDFLYEIVVADAGSEDGTVETARLFGARVVPGGLPGEGRNRGAEAARGRILLFVDADMRFPPDSLSGLIKEFEKRNLDIATSLIKPVSGSFWKTLAFDLFHNLPLLTIGKFLRFGTGFFMVRKELHGRVGGFDERVKLLEDTYYVRQASKQGRFGVLRGSRILFSERRFDENGWVRTYLKIVAAFVYTTLVGPIKTDIFKYGFGHKKE